MWDNVYESGRGCTKGRDILTENFGFYLLNLRECDLGIHQRFSTMPCDLKPFGSAEEVMNMNYIYT